jgi:hypothetical protein
MLDMTFNKEGIKKIILTYFFEDIDVSRYDIELEEDYVRIYQTEP